ncbi:hypothetical protein J2046_002730 [Rhizobium petrolearium]|uniref:TOTE conflict system archaeo-eukaryotic primase domain-containing protein n=1 Tax=Neorhizobium petrolearium TaxID=515361 RepID=UPI001AE994D9|nr:hypothetical protein [Neorhizobium petrolearium]MBP1844471.1 hypothetical protein [Neorhizobium petrolearium]
MTAPFLNDERRPSPAEKLHELFAGGPWHGTYRPEPTPLPGVKVEIKRTAKTLRGGPTPELWRQHLAGEQPLGICPLLPYDTCQWGAIDIDAYDDLDHRALVERIKAAGLPLVVCRSKSGGAHFYVFLAEPMSAAGLRQRLIEIAVALGYPPDTEIFPKQTSNTDIDKAGGWINMPYFDAENTNRYAVKGSGLAMTVPEFLEAAERARISPDALMALKVSSPAKTGVKAETSPTPDEFEALLGGWLRKLAEAPSGKADDTLMQVARDIGRWASTIDIDYPGVQQKVLEAWHERGKSDADFHAQYHSNLAAGQKKGGPPRLMTNGRTYPVIDKIVVITGGEADEWRLTLRGWGDITLPVKDVMHYYTFNVRCAEQLGAIFDQIKQDRWYELLRPARAAATFEEIPEAETQEHEMRELLRVFLTNKHSAENLEEVLLGRPFHDEKERRRYFLFDKFCVFLNGHTTSFGKLKPNIVGRWVRRAIGKENLIETKKKIKSDYYKIYYVPDDLFKPPPEIPLPKLEKPPI